MTHENIQFWNITDRHNVDQHEYHPDLRQSLHIFSQYPSWPTSWPHFIRTIFYANLPDHLVIIKPKGFSLGAFIVTSQLYGFPKKALMESLSKGTPFSSNLGPHLLRSSAGISIELTYHFRIVLSQRLCKSNPIFPLQPI